MAVLDAPNDKGVFKPTVHDLVIGKQQTNTGITSLVKLNIKQLKRGGGDQKQS